MTRRGLQRALALGILAAITLNGCVSLHRTEGRAAFDSYRYQDAIDHWGTVLKKRPQDAEALRALAASNFMINQHALALGFWLQLDSTNALTPQERLFRAQARMALGDHATALRDLTGPGMPTDAQDAAWVASLRAGCEAHLAGALSPWNVQIQPVEIPGLATTGGLDRAGNTWVFTGQTRSQPLNASDPYTGLSHADLYLCAADADGLRFTATPWNLLNAPSHDGYAAISPDERLVAWSRNNTGTGKSLRVNADRTSTIQLYFASADSAGNWSRPLPFPFNEENFNFAHPTWLPDAAGLIFASDYNGPGAQGGMDLWFTLRNGRFWNEPVNLGPIINTAGDELFPYLQGTDSLFFSSNGHPNMGGLDLQLSLRVFHENPSDFTLWGPPVPLPAPLNSPADDFCLRLDGPWMGSGYLSSDRSGADRIYRFTPPTPIPATTDTPALLAEQIPPPAPVLPASFSDSTGTPPKVSTPPQDTAAMRNTPQAYISSPVPNVPAVLPVPSNPTASTIPDSSTVPSAPSVPDEPTPIPIAQNPSAPPPLLSSPSPEATPTSNLPTDPPQSTGTPIPWPKDFILPEIYWDFDKARVRDKDNHPLSDLAQLLKENPHFHLEIHSHCDARGSTLYNVDLSQRRALAVQAQLALLGVPVSQMKSIGFGEYQIRNRCIDGVPCSEAEHQFNRRTQFLLVEPQ